MPVTQVGRAAAAISQPVDIEVFQDGVWWPGSILGWQHDAAGGCQVEVRLTVAGAERTTWADLADLRLSEPPAGKAASVDGPSVAGQEIAAQTVVMSRAALRERLAAPGVPVARPDRRRRHGGDVTADLPAVRCGGAGASSGRHRAPADPSGRGRHRAADTEPTPVDQAPGPDTFTRPIRLSDVASWPRDDMADAGR